MERGRHCYLLASVPLIINGQGASACGSKALPTPKNKDCQTRAPDRPGMALAGPRARTRGWPAKPNSRPPPHDGMDATHGQCARESWTSLPAWTAGQLGHRRHVERRPPPWCPPPPPGGASGRGATAHTDPWRCHLGVYKTVKRPHLSKVIIYRIFCTKAVFQKRL